MSNEVESERAFSLLSHNNSILTEDSLLHNYQIEDKEFKKFESIIKGLMVLFATTEVGYGGKIANCNVETADWLVEKAKQRGDSNFPFDQWNNIDIIGLEDKRILCSLVQTFNRKIPKNEITQVTAEKMLDIYQSVVKESASHS